MNVVLPAPFGPISACSSPRATAKSSRSVATRPPKRFCSPSTRSRMSATGRPPLRESSNHAGNAVSGIQHYDQEHHADTQLPVLGIARQHLFEHEKDQCAEHAAIQVADA